MFGADRSAVPTGGGRFRYQAHKVTMQKVHPHRQQTLLQRRVTCDTKVEFQSQGCKLWAPTWQKEVGAPEAG